jgi:hypothetical protein
MSDQEKKPECKPWWQSRTIWLNAAVAAVAIVEASSEALKPVLPPEAMGGLLAAVAVANVVLRAVSGQPVAFKKPPVSPKSPS